MSRRSKGARLWLRPARADGTKALWLILDGTRQLGTGCAEGERAKAEDQLLQYVEKKGVVRSKYVYFITTTQPGFPIKIGISESHHLRMTTLQTALPYPIRVLAVAPTDDPIFERRLHRKFSHIRLNGEWFENTPELMAYIGALVEDAKAA